MRGVLKGINVGINGNFYILEVCDYFCGFFVIKVEGVFFDKEYSLGI